MKRFINTPPPIIKIFFDDDDDDFFTDDTSKELKKRKKEVEEYDRKNKLSNDCETRILMSDLPVKDKSEIIKKMKESSFVEANKYLTYVNNLLRIPFNKYSEPIIKDATQIKDFLINAKNVLDSVVYKQEETKKSILDFCSRIITNPESKGKVLAIQSCKGMGKTKIIRQGLSKILNRPFFSINFGGLTDSNILLGHDYTYSGSKYGLISNILMESKVMDPIIYLDEIDKIGDSNKSREVFGVLTHLLDEEQNKEFHDNYFQGINIDLSKVLFILSFNDIDQVNHIVSDRMKIVKIPELTRADKIKILSDYIIPEIYKDTGIKHDDVIFSQEIIGFILDKNKSEAGMRQIKKTTESIIERINYLNLIDEIKFPVVISKEIVEKIIDFGDNEEQTYNLMYS